MHVPMWQLAMLLLTSGQVRFTGGCVLDSGFRRKSVKGKDLLWFCLFNFEIIAFENIFDPLYQVVRIDLFIPPQI